MYSGRRIFAKGNRGHPRGNVSFVSFLAVPLVLHTTGQGCAGEFGCIRDRTVHFLVRRYYYMQYLALACDYDGTLAKDGVVSPQTIAALERVGASGRKLILITGRLLEDLQMAFPRLDLFTYVVAENGALLYNPADLTEKLLGKAPPRQFIQALQERAVPPLVSG